MVMWKRPTFSKDRTLFSKEKSKLNQGRTLTQKGVHSIQGRPGSVGSPGQGCQCIKSNIKDRSSNVHTSDMAYSMGSHMKWGPKVSGTHSLLERFMPALVHRSTSPTLMTKILTSSSGTPHSTSRSSKPWKSWKIPAHWPRSPNCTPGPCASQSTQSWPESCKNSRMQCINSKRTLVTGPEEWSSSLRPPRGIWRPPKFTRVFNSLLLSWHESKSCKGSFTSLGFSACKRILNNITFNRSRAAKRWAGPTSERAVAAPLPIIAPHNTHSTYANYVRKPVIGFESVKNHTAGAMHPTACSIGIIPGFTCKIVSSQNSPSEDKALGNANKRRTAKSTECPTRCHISTQMKSR